MKTCFQCHGPVTKVVGTVTINGVTIDDIPYELCTQCQEKYFDEKTSIFIQNIHNHVKEERQKLLLGLSKE